MVSIDCRKALVRNPLQLALSSRSREPAGLAFGTCSFGLTLRLEHSFVMARSLPRLTMEGLVEPVESPVIVAEESEGLHLPLMESGSPRVHAQEAAQSEHGRWVAEEDG